jgi:hypothetical protein
MIKRTTTFTLHRLAVVLVAGVTLMTAANVAAAREHHSQNSQNIGSNFRTLAINFPDNGNGKHHHKKDMRDRDGDRDADRKHDKFAKRKNKHCEKISVPTKGCPINSKDPVGNTHPGGTAGKPPTKPISGHPGNTPGTVTITGSTGVFTVPDTPGKFTAAASNSGAINLYFDGKLVAIPGDTVTLKGEALSTYVADRGGLKQIVNSDGSVTLTRMTSPQTTTPPVAQQPPKPAGNGGGDGVIVGTLKGIGNTVEDIGVGLINIGGPTPPTTSTISQQ